MAYYQQQVLVSQKRGPAGNKILNRANEAYLIPRDPLILLSKGALFVLADGRDCATFDTMAAEIVLDTVINIYYQHPAEAISDTLSYAIKQANQSLYIANEQIANEQQCNQRTPCIGLCTTCLAVVIQNETAYIAGVGHSHVYLIRDEQIYCLNEAMTKVDNIHTTLGQQPEMHIHTVHQPLQPGDTLLLCSEGLYRQVNIQDIHMLIDKKDPQKCIDPLIKYAQDKGGADIAALILHIPQ